MRVGSIFSGIGAPEVAWRDFGWDFRWCAEIDPFPAAVYRRHFPGVPNLGNVEEVDWDHVEPIDLLVFGSPCQAFSVAGRRLGLDDPRGNLTLLGIRTVAKLKPRYVVWENVPGVLSDSGGDTIRTVVDMLTELGYACDMDIWDAQHFGVPQRRRRVFISAVRIEEIAKDRNLASERIMGDLLIQAMHATWGATVEPLLTDPNHPLFVSRIDQPADALKNKMRALDALLGGSAVKALLAFWDEPGTDPMAETIEEVWKNFWQQLLTGEPLDREKASRLARLSLATLETVVSLNQNSLNGPWTTDHWSLALNGLTLTQDISDYARSASCELFIAPEHRAGWRDNLLAAQACHHVLERCFGIRAEPGTVQPFIEGLRGDPAKSQETRQRVAASLTHGVDSSGKGGYAGRRREDDVNLVPAFNNTGHGWWNETDAATGLRTGGGGKEATVVANPMGSNQTGGWRGDLDGDTIIPIAAPLDGNYHKGQGNRGSTERTFVAGALQERDYKGSDSDTKPGHLIVTGHPNPAHAITAGKQKEGGVFGNRGADQDTYVIPLLEIGKGTTSRGEGPNGAGFGEDGDPMFTLQSGAQHGVVIADPTVMEEQPVSANLRNGLVEDGTAMTLQGGGMGADRGRCINAIPHVIVAHSLRADGFDASEDGTGRGIPLVPVEDGVIPVKKPHGSSSNGAKRNSIAGKDGDPMFTIDGTSTHAVAVTHSLDAAHSATEDGTGRGIPLVATGFYQNQGSHGGGAYADTSPTLKSDSHAGNLPAVAVEVTHALNVSGRGGDVTEDGTGRGIPLIPVTTHALDAHSAGTATEDGTGRGVPIVPVEDLPVSHSLTADNAGRAQEDGTGRGVPLIPVQVLQCNGSDVGVNVPSLRAGNGHFTGGVPAVMTLAIRNRDGSSDLEVREDGTVNAIVTPNGGRGGINVGAVAYGIRSDAVREGVALTPSPDAEGYVRLRDPGMGVYENLAPTVDAGQPHAVAVDWKNSAGDPNSQESFMTLSTERHPAVALPVDLQNASLGSDVSGTLDSEHHGRARAVMVDPVAFESRYARNGRGAPSSVVPPLKAQSGETGKGDSAPLVAYALGSHAGTAEGEDTNRSHAAGGPVGANISEDSAYSLRADRTQAVAFHENQRAEVTLNDTAGSLKVGGGKPGQGYPAVMQPDQPIAFAQNQQGVVREMPYTGAVKAEHGMNETTYVAIPIDEPGKPEDAVVIRTGGDYADPYLSLDDKAFLAANPMSDRQMAVAYNVTGTGPNMKTGGYETDVHTALRSRTPGNSEGSTTTLVTQPAAADSDDPAFAIDMGANKNMRYGGDFSEDFTHGLPAGQPHAVAFTASEQANSYAWERPVYPAINAQVPHDSSNIQYGIRQAMSVRRLTPKECERLQGFPDDYTAITYRNKVAADGPRYRVLGNSMAVPVMRWIGQRIKLIEELRTRRG
jgi:site-specific DNA-cytosine methylase